MAKSLEERRHALLDLQQRFRHLAREYQDEATQIAKGTESIPDTSQSSSGNRTAEWATDTYTQELDLTLRNRYRYRLTAIDEALSRMEQGMYGRCAVCDQPISELRLDMMPETPFCSEHAGTAEAADMPDPSAPPGRAA